ncbi:hypothetical protein RJ640_015577 [Escallonia rubra]|uniref:SHSP domain-containing protein n=1 Tax=Escallonia rubra TaxID=112253 RepID=A0AA88U9M8_9ASTE|nr:hypothetical protein RJ640_015577 [Escallonia rubra]
MISGSVRGKKDALTTLYKLCSARVNKERAVTAGVVRPLVAMVAERGTGLAEKAMVVLEPKLVHVHGAEALALIGLEPGGREGMYRGVARQIRIGRFGMPNSYVHLHPVDFVRLAINLHPPLEPVVVEVLPHHLCVASADLLSMYLAPLLWVGEGEDGSKGSNRSTTDDEEGRGVERGGGRSDLGGGGERLDGGDSKGSTGGFVGQWGSFRVCLQVGDVTPDIGKENVKVYMEHNTLVIKGEAESESDDEEPARRYASRLNLPPNT